jgi:hypothetical protein
MEKKIVKKNVEVKKDAKLVEDLSGLGLERSKEKNRENIKTDGKGDNKE